MWYGPDHESFENRSKLTGLTYIYYLQTHTIFLFKDIMLNYYIFYFIISILGTVYTGPFFNSILVLDVIHKFPVLANVIKAVQVNIFNLLKVGFLMFLVIYMLSLIMNFYLTDLEVMSVVVPWNDE